MQGIYYIKKNDKGTFISTDKLGDFRIEPERISEDETLERAQQDAEWEEMLRETAKRDVEDTKARMVEEEERRTERARQEAEEEARRESERRMEAEQREIERKLEEKGTVTVDPYLRAPVIKGGSE
jgi:FKBP-type peptidyl-prolyl cis-trans isomerase